MAALSSRLDLAKEVNRHFLENERGNLTFFVCCFELSNKFLYVNKYGPNLSVGQEAIVGNVNLVSNRNYNHGTIIRIYGV